MSTPYFSLNCSIVGDEPGVYSPVSYAFPVRSMYAGQFANFSGPVGEGTGVGDAGVGVGVDGGGVGMLTEAGGLDPDVPPVHAARNAAKPANAVPCRNRRRVRSVLSGSCSGAIGSSSVGAG